MAVNDKRTLYVGGLEESVTEATLRAAFVPFGEITDVNLPLETSGAKHKGFAFVQFDDHILRRPAVPWRGLFDGRRTWTGEVSDREDADFQLSKGCESRGWTAADSQQKRACMRAAGAPPPQKFV